MLISYDIGRSLPPFVLFRFIQRMNGIRGGSGGKQPDDAAAVVFLAGLCLFAGACCVCRMIIHRHDEREYIWFRMGAVITTVLGVACAASVTMWRCGITKFLMDSWRNNDYISNIAFVMTFFLMFLLGMWIQGIANGNLLLPLTLLCPILMPRRRALQQPLACDAPDTYCICLAAARRVRFHVCGHVVCCSFCAAPLQ